jgi:hypothetical protein
MFVTVVPIDLEWVSAVLRYAYCPFGPGAWISLAMIMT